MYAGLKLAVGASGRRWLSAALAVALVFATPLPRAAGQLTVGTVSGTVLDPQGASLPGASVTLVNEANGTKLPVVKSDASGDFVIPNVPPGTYTLEIAQQGFKALRRPGITVSPGDRVGVGRLTLEVGMVTEQVTVVAEAPLLQTQSAERSQTVERAQVENIPLLNRVFTNLIATMPGVGGSAQQPSRMGDSSSYGGGNSNIMIDGVSTMDTGNNALMISVNTESIAEIKILVSGYQAEYGRSSGLQISAVTKSGSNNFHGSAFLAMRSSGWNARNKTDILNNNPKSHLREKDFGFTIGGPIGKPGGANKLFFFYSHEIDPRSGTVTGGSVVTYRFPTALERAGDFSQSRDNNGNLYPYIKDPLSPNPCSASNTSGCFKDGGVLGRIPPDRLYPLGLKILNLFPMPNLDTPGLNYNYRAELPVQNIRSQAPITKIDYQPWDKLRGSFRLSLWEQPNNIQTGTLPGFNDTQVYKRWFYTWASTVTYSVSPVTFVEGTFGRARNDLAGHFGPTNSAAPTFATNAIPMSPLASLSGAGLTGLPLLFPDAGVLDPNYYAFKAMEALKPPMWDGKKMNLVPQFSWGGRISNAPPNFPFPGWLNTNQTYDISVNATHVRSSHTIKTGLYVNHSYKAQQSLTGAWQGSINFGNNVNNPLDSGFGFANAALGVFYSYSQLSKYVEGNHVYRNIETYIQDNWKVTPRLTLDYGVRFVHQQPQHDKLGQGVNWLPEKWTLSKAPLYYEAGCVGAAPCSGSNRQARDPRTGQLLGPTSGVLIGTLVPDSGDFLNGLVQAGTDPVPRTVYKWPRLAAAPRLGIAYDLTGRQKIVLRAGAGLYFDRPSGNTIFSTIANPPNQAVETLYYSQLQTIGTGGLKTRGAPNLSVYKLESDYPSTWTWHGSVQYDLGWNSVLDVTYTGQRAYNIVEQVNINTVDFGAAFRPENQDPTVTSSLPGGAAKTANMLRSIRGFGDINMMLPRGELTSHLLTIWVNRRFSRGLRFGISDSIMLKRSGTAAARIEHAPDGSWRYRADQEQANKLFTDYIPTRHTFKADFVYSLPGLQNFGSGFAQKAIKAVTSDWQVSGIWTANSPTAYTVGYSFQSGGNQNITGSPNYGGRVRIVGDPGRGCNTSDIFRQFNTSAFLPPEIGSVGLESGMDYLRGCFYQQFDLALQRDFKITEGMRLSFRLDAFNAFNQSHITGRNTTMQVVSPTNYTIVNLPFDSSGNLIPARTQPRQAGFGMANSYQTARRLQAWVRFTF
ncbi:MAG: carboxypeptidase regulatory-like domain-containing protein [Bryobacteraceae bacterium]